MKKIILSSLLLVAGLALTLKAVAADSATVTVTLSDVHLCCGKCVTGATAAVAPVTGAKAVCDMVGKTVAITAPDKETAQKAVDALIAAGYFGKSSDSAIKVSADTGAKDAKVTSVEVTGLHLCCGTCVTAVNGILAKVPGVTGNTAKANAKSFTVTGDFNDKAMFDEFQKGGLTGKVAAAAK